MVKKSALIPTPSLSKIPKSINLPEPNVQSAYTLIQQQPTKTATRNQPARNGFTIYSESHKRNFQGKSTSTQPRFTGTGNTSVPRQRGLAKQISRNQAANSQSTKQKLKQNHYIATEQKHSDLYQQLNQQIEINKNSEFSRVFTSKSGDSKGASHKGKNKHRI
jgi:hypothetical protein